jgi:hypothetical protein
MRRYGLYDGTRGLTTALAAGIAGLLLWVATLVGVQTVTRFWEAMGIVAGAGLVLALSQVIGGWTKGGTVRISPTTFLVAFLPVLVCVGWILMATQPGNGWHEGRITSWSTSLGILGLVHSLGLWHGVLAFGFGLVLGTTMDAVPVELIEPVAAAPATQAMPVAEEPTTRTRRPWYRRRTQFTSDADAPTTAEARAQQRAAAHSAEPPMVTVGRNADDVEE